MDKPVRFALVDEAKQIYRGGQPDEADIERLKQLGIKTIINFRKEDLLQRRTEQKLCEKHSINYVEFPFYGIFGFDSEFIHEVVDMLYNTDGPIYMHCLNGRDRTSVMVASYLVKYHKKDPKVAWTEDVLKYDHDETDKYYSKFKTSFFEFCDKLNI
jgi:protein tyrosine/serine phosphatase